MPDEFNGLAEHKAKGVKRIVVAIGSGKDYHSKFHAVALPAFWRKIDFNTAWQRARWREWRTLNGGVSFWSSTFFFCRSLQDSLRRQARGVFLQPSLLCSSSRRAQFPRRPREHSP